MLHALTQVKVISIDCVTAVQHSAGKNVEQSRTDELASYSAVIRSHLILISLVL